MSSLEKFRDVEGVKQDDGERPVCAINYPEEYEELMDVLRAVLETGERSARVLELTADILEWNAAHYTVWVVRRESLHAVTTAGTNDETLRTKLYEDEMEYSEMVAQQNPKNYQIWYHRREVLKHLPKEWAVKELEFVERRLQEDAKNYHAWSHRLWVVKEYDEWTRELPLTEEMLDDDAWNNSVWNHRRAAVARALSQADCFEHKDEIAACEVDPYASKYVFSHGLRNEAPFSYMLDLARTYPSAAAALDKVVQPYLDPLPEGAVDPIEPADRCCFRMTKLDLLALKDTSESCDLAATHADILATEEDPFRVKYWTRRAWELRDRAAQLDGRPVRPPFVPVPTDPRIRVAPPAWDALFGHPVDDHDPSSSVSVATAAQPPTPEKDQSPDSGGLPPPPPA